MCGIVGFIDIEKRTAADPNAVLDRMLAVIRHRGPDDYGFYSHASAHLAHRRLSIVDLSPAGHQPMPNTAGDRWIIYNGEVFNHADLRPELERAGYRYRSRSDTETILYAYEEYGPDCVSKFRGMFSFAIWDASRRRLFCARDRLGIKPFYYYWNGQLFAFASEIKALLEHPAISPVFNDSLLPEYLAFGYVSSSETLFRNIHKLMPGHHLTLDAKPGAEPRIEQYWDVPQRGGPPSTQSEEEYIRECRQRLEESVRLRLMSDVPLGVFLSGGVDSSAIAALMTRMVSSEPVKTFSVGYHEASYSELGYAGQVAECIGTQHRQVIIGAEDFFNALPKLIWHEDEPIAWPSSISLYFVSKLAREDVTVVLTGEGSDELFAGYSRYQRYISNLKALRWYRLVPRSVRDAVCRGIQESGVAGAELRRKLQHTFLGRADSLESLHVDNFYSAFPESEQHTILAHPAEPGAAYSNFLRYWNSRDGSLLSRMLYADQKTYLIELLMKQDQMSMANSVESRVPFLDHNFVEFAARVPDNLKLKGSGKYILKRAVEDLLPREIIYRKKMGFPTPIRQWFKEDAGRPLIDILKSRKGFVGEYFRHDALDRLIEKHVSGQEDATDRLWRLLNLQIWGDLFFTGEREPMLQRPLLYELAPRV